MLEIYPCLKNQGNPSAQYFSFTRFSRDNDFSRAEGSARSRGLKSRRIATADRSPFEKLIKEPSCIVYHDEI